MNDDKSDENPFSFKHFIKNKNEDLDYQDKNVPSRLPGKQAGIDEPNVQNDELPFPEVCEITGTKKKAKGINKNSIWH